ncbi:hypothetical protein ACQP1V_21100 [Microtetraspora malaysiensis]|uniref:hypothetical protein n=1 Tax=Microtetraspora malaysiensis TaxID=161358 RepID=UPI003D8D328D
MKPRNTEPPSLSPTIIRACPAHAGTPTTRTTSEPLVLAVPALSAATLRDDAIARHAYEQNGGVDSARPSGALADFRRHLKPYWDVPTAREFLEHTA